MGRNKGNKKNKVVGIAVLVLSVSAFLFRVDIMTLYNLLSEGSLEDVVGMIRGWGMGAPILSILLMIIQAFVAPIPAFLITGANGVVFGFVWGSVISWVGAMLGAAGTFYLARFLGMDYVKKLEKSHHIVEKVDEISQNHGVKVILIGRLLPFISFDFLSYAAGLSTMRSTSFFLATGLGMLPGTIAYVLLGNQVLALSRYSGGVTFLVGIGLVLAFVYNRMYSSDSSKTKNNKE